MSLAKLTQGLPYSAVLALLGWLVLSQGQPPVQRLAPQTSALTDAPAERCEPRVGEAQPAPESRRSGVGFSVTAPTDLACIDAVERVGP